MKGRGWEVRGSGERVERTILDWDGQKRLL